MSFKIKNLQFNRFRNFHLFENTPSKDINLVLGDNAVGKTNLIEGIQLLTMMESFRNPSWDEVVNWDETTALITAVISDENVTDTINSSFSEGKRRYRFNEKNKKVGELKGIVPSVLFVPDDLRMVKDSSRRRRQALDQLGSQLSQTYYRMKNDYEKIVTQRNKLLKEYIIPQDLLDSWTESLITIGSLFYQNRINLFSRIKERYSQTFSFITAFDEADIEYIPFWSTYRQTTDDPERIMRDIAMELESREKEHRMTLIGPHKDEMVFYVNGKDARQFGSQGQQRSLVLAWKLTEVEVIQDITGKIPILLLDDVMSELDENKRNSLLDYIEEKEIQTFITSANESYFPPTLLSEAHIIRLET